MSTANAYGAVPPYPQRRSVTPPVTRRHDCVPQGAYAGTRAAAAAGMGE